MRISPIINNKIYPKNNYCNSYTFTRKHDKNPLESGANCFQRAEDIFEMADSEMKRIGSTIGFDCYSSFQDVFDNDGKLKRTYTSATKPDEKVLFSFYRNSVRKAAFNAVNLDIKSVEVTYSQTKKKNTFFFDENQHIKRAVIGQKKKLFSNVQKADEVLYFNNDGSITYFENVILANDKGKVRKAKKQATF